MPRMPSLASIEEAATEVAGTAAAVSGRLRVNVDPWFARMVLAPRLRRFLIQYPLLSVELTVSNHREEMMEEQMWRSVSGHRMVPLSSHANCLKRAC
jgi:DNA-binding transcriptional LysR family regulator